MRAIGLAYVRRRLGESFFHLFYTWTREKNGFFTPRRLIVASMRTTSRRLRQFSLAVLVLVAVGHANLAADLTGRAPNTCGMTRLGRDLLRNHWVWNPIPLSHGIS
jgi:hypothetical protein